MAFDNIAKKAQGLLNDPRLKDALKSEKAEDVSDKILDGIAGAADKVTGGKHTEKITKARDAADKNIGNQ